MNESILKTNDEQELYKFLIKDEASNFIQKLQSWFDAFSNYFDSHSLDFKVKQLCIDLIHKSNNENEFRLNSYQKIFISNTNKIYACVYHSLYVLIKLDPYLSQKYNVKSFETEDLKALKNFFIHRVLVYDSSDFIGANLNHNYDNKTFFVMFLDNLFDFLVEFMREKSQNLRIVENFGQEIGSILKQIDTISHSSLVYDYKNQINQNIFIKKLLKNSWTYLIDVLAGFILNTNLTCIENLLFGDTKYIDLVNNTDFSLTIFALKSCLESLEQIVRIMIGLRNLEMKHELNQLYFLLLEANYFNHSMSQTKISLNRVLCIDFVLYTTSFNLNLGEKSGQSNKNMLEEEILWKYLVESVFFCLYLHSNNSTIHSESDRTNENDPLKNTNLIKIFFQTSSNPKALRLPNRKSIFKSIHFNTIKESITLNRASSVPAPNQDSFDYEPDTNKSNRESF